MNLEYVGYCYNGSESKSSLSVTLPVACEEGDLLIALYQHRYSVVPSTPSEFTFICGKTPDAGSSGSWGIGVAYRVLGSSWDSSVTFNFHHSYCNVQVFVFRGDFDASDVIETFSNIDDPDTDDYTCWAGSVSVATQDASLLLLSCRYGVGVGSGKDIKYYKTVANSQYSIWSVTAYLHAAVDTGATGNIEITLSGKSYYKHTICLVIKPKNTVKIERKVGSGGSYSELTEQDWADGTYQDGPSGLSSGNTYYYRGKHSRGGLESGYSNEKSVTYTALIVYYAAGSTSATGSLTSAARIRKLLAGNLAGSAGVSGAIKCTTFTSGALSVVGSAEGSMRATLYGVGSLAGMGSLEGSVARKLLASGALGAVSLLDGQGLAELLTSGEFVGAGTLSGVLAGIGIYLARGSLSAVSALSASGKATLYGAGSAAGGGALDGSSVVVLSLSGALDAGGVLIGLPLGLFSARGALGAGSLLSGDSLARFLASGEFAGVGGLVASGKATLCGAGSVTGGGTLAGSSVLVLPLAGVLDAGGVLAGSSLGLFLASGGLGSTGGLGGAAGAELFASGGLRVWGLLSGSLFDEGDLARFWKTPPIRRLICPVCGVQQVDKLMTRCQNCGFPLRGVGAR